MTKMGEIGVVDQAVISIKRPLQQIDDHKTGRKIIKMHFFKGLYSSTTQTRDNENPVTKMCFMPFRMFDAFTFPLKYLSSRRKPIIITCA